MYRAFRCHKFSRTRARIKLKINKVVFTLEKLKNDDSNICLP